MAVRTEKRRGTRRYVIDIHYRDENGRRQRFRRDAEVQTMRAARAEERRRWEAIARFGDPERIAGRPATEEVVEEAAPDVGTTTFAEAVEIYLEVYGTTRLKPSTVDRYQRILDGFLLPRIGKLPLDEFDANVMRQLDAALVKRKVTSNTRRQHQCVIRSVCRWAVEAGLLDEQPRWPKLPKMNGRVQVFLTAEDVAAILEVTPPPYRLGLELAAFAGLRAGEVRGLRWMDVDFERGFLVVRRNITRGGISTPKSGSERQVPLHEGLRRSLLEVSNRRAQWPVTGPKPGEVWSERALYDAFKRACKKAELPGFRFHDLRHAFVTMLFQSGASAPVVQQLAGHLHLTTTQRYAHASRADLFAAIHSLPGGRACGNNTETGPSETDTRRLDRKTGS